MNNFQTILHYTMRSCLTQFNLAYPEHIVNNLPPPLPFPPLVTPNQLNSTQLNSTQFIQINSSPLISNLSSYLRHIILPSVIPECRLLGSSWCALKVSHRAPG